VSRLSRNEGQDRLAGEEKSLGKEEAAVLLVVAVGVAAMPVIDTVSRSRRRIMTPTARESWRPVERRFKIGGGRCGGDAGGQGKAGNDQQAAARRRAGI